MIAEQERIRTHLVKLNAEAEHDLLDRSDLDAGHAPAHEHVDLILPAGKGIRAARVVYNGLAHRQVELIAHRHVGLEARDEAAVHVHPKLLRARVEDGD